jgi:hypothetical protein
MALFLPGFYFLRCSIDLGSSHLLKEASLRLLAMLDLGSFIYQCRRCIHQDHISSFSYHRASTEFLPPLSTQPPTYAVAPTQHTTRFPGLISVDTMLFHQKSPCQSYNFESFHLARYVRCRGRHYFVSNATAIKPMTHPIASSYLHSINCFLLPSLLPFPSCFLPPLLPFPSSSVRLLNSLFRRRLFSSFSRRRSTLLLVLLCYLFRSVINNSNCYNDHYILQITTEILY